MDQTIFEFGRIQASEDWIIYGLLLVGLLTLVTLLYRRDARQLGRPIRVLLTLLRCAVVVILFWVFLDPRWRTESTVEQPSRTILLADTSLSMSIPDGPATDPTTKTTRQSAMIDALSGSDFLATLRQKQQVAIYRFGRELAPVALIERQRVDGSPTSGAETSEANNTAADTKWLEALRADQDQTRLGDALAEAIRRESAGPVAGVILITDGQSNAGGSIEAAIERAKEIKAPIHAIGLGSDKEATNLRVADLQLPTRVFRGDQFKVTALLQGTGDAQRMVPVQLTLAPRDAKQEPTVLETRQVTLPADGSPLGVEFEYLPEESGQWRIGVRVAAEANELRQDDNQATAGVEVIDRKTKVLLFAGGPTREYQFLRNLLYRDKSIELTVLLQTAQDSISQDAHHVLRSFPTERADLFAYDVIVAFDPDWTSVEGSARALLGEWVGAQAGGLILVAGRIHTPRLARDETLDEVQALYPVVLKEIFTSELESGNESEPWPVALTPEGEATDFLRLEEDVELSKQRWKDFSGFYSSYPVLSVKPGASVLAEFADPRARTGGLAPPIFASQFYGSGRVFYVGSGEIWRLRALGDQFHDRFWIRVIRQLGQSRLLRGASRGSLMLEAERYSVGSTITIRANLLDERFQPLLGEAPPLSLVDPAGAISELALKPETGRPGRFITTLPARLPGEYRLQLLVPGATEVIERRLQVSMPDLEFDNPRLNRELLARLTRETGGKLWTIDQLNEIPPLLEDRGETSVFSGSPNPLWDRPWVMIAVATLLSLEWLIRKLLTLG